MRQIGSLSSGQDAHRFAAHLVASGVQAHAEEDGDAWAIWVRDENEVARARDSFEVFQANPQDKRYDGADKFLQLPNVPQPS